MVTFWLVAWLLCVAVVLIGVGIAIAVVLVIEAAMRWIAGHTTERA